ncbi:MAG: DUF4097 family beta strand repeat-containing protein [Myxococcota bacterium]
MTFHFRRLPLLVAFLLPACVIDLDGDLLDGACIDADPRTETVTIDEPIHAVVIDNGTGDINVRAHDDPGARVDAKFYGDGPDGSWLRVEDGVLHVVVDCEGCCGADLTLTVPAAAELDVELGTGDVEVSDRSGSVDVDLGTGDIELERVAGALVLSVGTGDIEGEELAGPAATAELGTGDISLDFDPAAPPQTVAIEAGTASVDLHLPNGTYDLDLQTDTGEISTDDLHHEAGADRRIAVSVGTGTIDVRGH